MGAAFSAAVAASLLSISSFPRVRLGLLAGICGGVPKESDGKEILLGDVIIISTGLVRFTFGQQYSNKVERKDTLEDNLGRPNQEIRALLTKIEGLRRGRSELIKNTSIHLAKI